MADITDARPWVVTEWAPTAGAFDALSSCVWLDLEDKIRQWTMKRGKQHELGVTEHGRGSLEWDNVDRDMDPTNTANPNQPNLRPMRRIRRRCEWGATKAITGATNATPIVVTSTAHGRSNGELVSQAGIGGNAAANGVFKVTGVTANTYQLTNVYNDAPVAGSGAYTSGGTGRRFYWNFHGYMVDFPTSWDGPNSSTTHIELVDAFALFQRIPIPGSPWEFVVRKDRPTFWFKPGSGDVATDVVGQHPGTYQGRPGFENPIIPGYDGAGFAPNRHDTPGARASFPHKTLITGFPFTVECVFRAVEDRAAQKVILFGSEGASGGGRLQLIIDAGGFGGRVRASVSNVLGSSSTIYSTIPVDDGQVHHLVWAATATNNMKLYLDGVNVTTVASTAGVFPTDLNAGYAIGNSPAVTFGDFSFATQQGDALGDVLIYDGVSLDATGREIYHWFATAEDGWQGMSSGNRVAFLADEIGWPAEDLALDLGGTTMPGNLVAGSLLANFQAIERAEAGTTYMGRDGKLTHRDRYRPVTSPGNVSQWAFGDGPTKVAYIAPVRFGGMEADLYTRAEGSRQGGPKQVVINDAAEAEYGIRAMPSLDGLLAETDGLVQDYLHYKLDLYDEPVVRVRSVVTKPQEDYANVWPKVLGHELGTKVTFEADPPGGGPQFVQESHLESIDETWTPFDVVYGFGLSPAADTEWAFVGTATVGGPALVAF